MPYVIAIDGRCASGKTTLSALLEKKLRASLIHMDDFFLPLALRTKERLSEPGGNVHYERFAEEVLPFLKKGGAFSYRKFDCQRMDFFDTVEIKGNDDFYVVEGAYSFHPALGGFADFKIFCDVSVDKQIERIKKRNGEHALKQFLSRWIPMEEAYISRFDIKSQADIVLSLDLLQNVFFFK